MATKKVNHTFIVRFRTDKDRDDVYKDDFTISPASRYYVSQRIAAMLYDSAFAYSNGILAVNCTIHWCITPKSYILVLTLD